MVAFQLTIDCADPGAQARFWAHALRYRMEDAPDGFPTWREYWLSVGVPEEELGDGECCDSIVDPEGDGPRIWFQQVPEGKVVKNRLHLDVKVGGKRAEVPWRPAGSGSRPRSAGWSRRGPPGCACSPNRAWTTTGW